MGNVFPLVNLDSILAFYLFEDNKFIHILSPIPCPPALEHWLPPKARREQVHPGQPLLALLAETDNKEKIFFPKEKSRGAA